MMPMYYLANGSVTSLAAPCLSTDTTITVLSSAAFPPSPTYALLIEGEVLYVTGVAGDVWTVTRAAEPYAGVQLAAGHPAGALVWGVLTAGLLSQIVAVGVSAALAALGGLTGSY